jgi:cytochrome c oxidase assembly protein Cox11
LITGLLFLLTSLAPARAAERARSPIKIPIRAILSATPELDVRLSTSEVSVQPGEIFEVSLKITNRSSRAMVARIGHVVEPYDVADFLVFVECGFLLPVTLAPGEQEYSGRYVVRSAIPEGVRRLNITYDFRPLK